MNRVICDVESFRNVFICSVKDFDTKEIITWEISRRKNDINKIKDWFDKFENFLITFNGIHYDTPMLLFLMQNNFKDWYDCTSQLKDWSDILIKEDRWWAKHNLRKYKYHDRWIDVDLFLYWSKGLRLSKKISLKGLAIQMNYPVIQELPFLPEMELTDEQINKLIEYNAVHDLNVTEWMLEKPCRWQGKLTTMNEQVQMRGEAYEKYDFEKGVFSWDGVKLGLNILVKSYIDKTWEQTAKSGRNSYQRSKQRLTEEVWNSRSTKEPIKLGDIILDKIKFKETALNYRTTKKGIIQPNSFYSLLEDLKNRTVIDTDELSYSVLYKDVKYDIKSGGLHSWHKNDTIEPDLRHYIYRDADVSGYYPALGAMYRFTPDTLPGMDVFLNEFRIERLQDKKAGRKAEERLKKLALNGGYYGNLNNEYTPMYYPKGLLSTTINGQLLLLMLAEWFQEIGVQVDMANTDGITAIIPRDKENQYKEVCQKWEELSLMELEFQDFKKVIRANVNNYLAIDVNDNVKEKGFFLTEPDFGSRIDFLVIPKALKAFYTKGTLPETFIKEHNNIFDFVAAQKVDRSFEVVWNNQVQQRLNRYYISSDSPFLYKYKNGKKAHMMKGFGVQIYNNHIEQEMSRYNINYDFYIGKTYEVISEVSNKNQLKLF